MLIEADRFDQADHSQKHKINLPNYARIGIIKIKPQSQYSCETNHLDGAKPLRFKRIS